MIIPPVICSAIMPDVVGACPVTGRPRNPAWDRESRAWLKDHPCAVTGATECVAVHHIRPVHLFPELEMDPANWIVLRAVDHKDWHFYLGHFGNWSNWNPDVAQDAARIAHRIKMFREGKL